jgi:hypothetical protein
MSERVNLVFRAEMNVVDLVDDIRPLPVYRRSDSPASAGMQTNPPLSFRQHAWLHPDWMNAMSSGPVIPSGFAAQSRHR